MRHWRDRGRPPQPRHCSNTPRIDGDGGADRPRAGIGCVVAEPEAAIVAADICGGRLRGHAQHGQWLGAGLVRQRVDGEIDSVARSEAAAADPQHGWIVVDVAHVDMGW